MAHFTLGAPWLALDLEPLVLYGAITIVGCKNKKSSKFQQK